jgi:hypothetical protein
LIRPAQVLRNPPDLLVELASFHELFKFNSRFIEDGGCFNIQSEAVAA